MERRSRFELRSEVFPEYAVTTIAMGIQAVLKERSNVTTVNGKRDWYRFVFTPTGTRTITVGTCTRDVGTMRRNVSHAQ